MGLLKTNKRWFQIFFLNGTAAKVEISPFFDVNKISDFQVMDQYLLVNGADGVVRHYLRDKVTMFKIEESEE